MARTLNRLTAGKVATARGPAVLRDGGHLVLRIDKNQNKRWTFVYANNGREREISLGTYPALSLADARKKRDQMNAALANGEPLASPRQKDALTFGAIAAEVMKRRSSAWRGEESARHWKISIEQHCASLLTRPIASISLEDVLAVLRPLHDRAPSFADITGSRIADVFTYAQARGLLPQDKANPADGRLIKILLPAAPRSVHRAALPYGDVPALVAELHAIPLSDARVVAARALEFAVLTALRVGEVCGANWEEVDVDRRLLSIPGERMKAGVPHQLPLSSRALDIIRELAPLRSDDGIVFPGPRGGRAVDGDQPLRLLQRLRPGITVHGFRSSFRDWAGDATAFPREVAEAALAHVVGGVEGAYRRASALEKRRALEQTPIKLYHSRRLRSNLCIRQI
ncbi:MAG TPA: integrase arm-type DNA-binding domain-containing protein [Roseiarcus sp.]|jgi:integrase|nr:integrase arm-type DNA-binding domain-containing protein [Roseiarcus sp.]